MDSPRHLFERLLQDVRFDTAGRCIALTFDGTVPVSVELIEGGSALAVHADLGPVPAGADSHLLEAMLAANLPSDHRRGVLAIDPITSVAVLFRRLDIEQAAYESFIEDLHAFADVAVRAREALVALAEDRIGPNEFSDALAVTPASTTAGARGEGRWMAVWNEHVRGRGQAAHEGADAQALSDVLLSDAGHYLLASETPDGLMLKAVLAFVSVDGLGRDTLVQLLQGHLLGEATRGAFFALDESTGELLLCRHVPAQRLEASGLTDELDRLATTALHFASTLHIEPPVQDIGEMSLAA